MRPKAKLSPTDVAKAISARTGLSPKMARTVIDAYVDIVKEALMAQVEVPFGRFCIFSWTQYQPKKDFVNWDYRTHAMTEPHDTPGYQKTSVRVSSEWQKKLKEATLFFDGEENPVGFEKMYGIPEQTDLEDEEEENDELQIDDDDE